MLTRTMLRAVRRRAGDSSSSSSCRRLLAGACAAAAPGSSSSSMTYDSTLVDWVVSCGGSVSGVGAANLAGSDGGSGWGLVATEVRACARQPHAAGWARSQAGVAGALNASCRLRAASAAAACQAVQQPGVRLVQLPRACQLSYDEASDPRLLALISQVPEELWGAKLALQVRVGGTAWHGTQAGMRSAAARQQHH